MLLREESQLSLRAQLLLDEHASVDIPLVTVQTAQIGFHRSFLRTRSWGMDGDSASGMNQGRVGDNCYQNILCDIPKRIFNYFFYF